MFVDSSFVTHQSICRLVTWTISLQQVYRRFTLDSAASCWTTPRASFKRSLTLCELWEYGQLFPRGGPIWVAQQATQYIGLAIVHTSGYFNTWPQLFIMVERELRHVG